MSQVRIPIVKVRWQDSCTNTHWADRKYHEAQTVSSCESVGYQITRTARHIQLAQSLADTAGHMTDVISIPRKVVTSIEVIGWSVHPK